MPVLFIFFSILQINPVDTAARQKLVTIGTGSIAGVYYPCGVAIGTLANLQRKAHGLRFAVEATSGSRFNLKTVTEGELDFGFVQSDVQYQATKGTGSFKRQGPVKSLRSVFSLSPEFLFLVTRADASIKTIEDLPGKRVNIGNRGSGQAETFKKIMEIMGWNTKTFSKILRLKSNEQSRALCDDKVDAIIFTAADSSKSILDATKQCDTIFSTISGKKITTLLSRYPYYKKMTIPGGKYRGVPHDIQTIGVMTTLVTNADVPENIVYELVRAVFENFDTFKQKHPALTTLNKADMVKVGLYAPLHKGALKYFKEAGLL